MKKILALIFLSFLGCAHCSPQNGEEPYIRTQPGIEYCGAMCQKFTDLKCTGYYEDIQIDCNQDPIYFQTMQCDDAGLVTLNCTQFCEYEMHNSVQLNPQCLAENLVVCDDIEKICR
jgi:hypothetical protein